MYSYIYIYIYIYIYHTQTQGCTSSRDIVHSTITDPADSASSQVASEAFPSKEMVPEHLASQVVTSVSILDDPEALLSEQESGDDY